MARYQCIEVSFEVLGNSNAIKQQGERWVKSHMFSHHRIQLGSFSSVDIGFNQTQQNRSKFVLSPKLSVRMY